MTTIHLRRFVARVWTEAGEGPVVASANTRRECTRLADEYLLANQPVALSVSIIDTQERKS